MAADVRKVPLIGVIDEGTKTVRFVVFRSQCSDELASYSEDIVQETPMEGWAEQDPRVILDAVRRCARGAIQMLTDMGYDKKDIVTLGITNQRETTIVWDKYSGEPLYNAISWGDTRTAPLVEKLAARQDSTYASGLPLSPYFSAPKLRWLMDNVRSVKRAKADHRCLFGTVDTWLIWNLTGGPKGGLHMTDVTNASRTLLMNIDTLTWDPTLLTLFNIDAEVLPEIRSSAEVYGKVSDGSILDGIPISGILGNQQAALVGHMCLNEGQAKNTYRSGCFLLYNTGTKIVRSTHGLATTVAYQLGKDAPVVYALEGSIAVAGGALKWLRDKLRIVQDIDRDVEALASSTQGTGDVYFVPAFNGLLAPYWRKDARGIICGLTSFTTKNHLIRAALEAICFQTKDVLEAMNKDSGCPLAMLHVDGKLSSNNLLMQLQADISGIPVWKSHSWDMTALGAAMAAGVAVKVWDLGSSDSPHTQHFLPTNTENDRTARYTKWKMAVQRSLGWAYPKKSTTMTDNRYRLLSSIPGSLFFITSFTLLVVSQALQAR